jgi:hypothetical protein
MKRPMPLPVPDGHTDFRRCPSCGRVERIDTGEVLIPGDPSCGVKPETFAHFTAPMHWHPEGNEASSNRPYNHATDADIEALARRMVNGSKVI